MAEPLDAYKVLQVDPEAEDEVIQAAHRRLARKYHPDLATGPEAALRMAAINAAWELVGEPAARAVYDRARTSSISRPAGPGGARASAPAPGPGQPRPTTQQRPAGAPPPGRPSGSVLNFGRYSGWSLGEIARHDLEYIEWLDRTPIGRTYREEVDTILRSTGRRSSASREATERRGLFRRR
jgi:curved DNA-binding protein CbpA